MIDVRRRTLPAMQVKLLDLQAQYAGKMRDEIRAAIDDVCDRQALILGPAVSNFEVNLARYCGVKHAVGVTSGTDALLVSLMALDVGPGDEVICPTFTFFATAGCVTRLGARPVFVDVDPDTFNIDAAAVGRAITPRTKAIIPVHLFGQMADMGAVLAVAGGVPVIEDAAQAIGATRHGKPACSVGRVGCLSFYPTKNLGAFGDAGAVCTNDDQLADRIRLLREHGMRPRYHYREVGGMFRLAAIQAAVLDVKLRYLDGWHDARRRNAAVYDDALAGSGVVTPSIAPGNQSVYNQYVVRIPAAVADRDAVRQRLADAGVGSEVYYPFPLHTQPCFADLGYRTGDFPIAERLCGEVLALPIYAELPADQLRYAADQLVRRVPQLVRAALAGH
jgi:dTDP-4-amino-4,6-dideoxygalactose transaminase